MKNYSYNRKISDKLMVKGTLSEDCIEIKYFDDNKEEQTVSVEECMSHFANQGITFTITLNTVEEDLMGED